MFTPDYLKNFPDYIVELFEQYDSFVVQDFARRVAKAARVTETAEWQAIRAHEMGLAMDELTRRSAELMDIAQAELVDMFNDAYDTYIESDRNRFSGSGLNYNRVANNPTLKTYMEAAKAQTLRSLRNIAGHPNAIKSMTGTTATMLKIGNQYHNVRKAYTMALDLAQMQVSSGVLDYETAVRQAIKSIAKNGLSTMIDDAVGYDSGYRLSVRAAARMCVLTGINQMAGNMNKLVCDELELDLVETSAHLGARPDHQEWQGQIFSLSGKSTKYQSLAEGTGYGRVDGLMGANCRHNFYGWYEGSPRAYTDEELYAMTDEGGPKVEWNGRTLTYYEATQKQRSVERQIIATKRELIGFDAVGDKESFNEAAIRLRNQKQTYQRFSNAAGISPKWERTQQDGYDRSISGKTSYFLSPRTVDGIKNVMEAQTRILPKYQREVLSQYTGSLAQQVNFAIKTGFINKRIQEKMKVLDAALKDGVMPKDVTLHRDTSLSLLNFGLPAKPSAEDLKKIIGRSKLMEIYTSTSFENLQLPGRNTELWISVKKGYKGCQYLKPVAKQQFKYQEEVLFARGLTLRITDAKIQNNKYVFWMEVEE